jgi:LPXTG-motif cell wall-anchored protein
MSYIGEYEEMFCGAKCKAEAEALKVNAQAALIGAKTNQDAANKILGGEGSNPTTGSDNTMVYVIVGVVVLIIAVVTIIIIKKKRG